MKIKAQFMIFTTIALVLMSACNNKPRETSKGSEPQDNKPVTLKFYSHNVLTDEDYQAIFVNPIREKYPNVTLERIAPDKGKTITDLVTAGVIPDIITTWSGSIGVFEDLKLTQEITPLAKKHNLDLNQFETVNIDAAKSSDKSKVYGIPWYQQFAVIYYNKDIFDNFGMPYPRDGMTWEETIDLGRKMTRNVDGIQYKGLSTSLYSFSSPLSLSYVDSKSGKASVNNDSWKKALQLQKDVDSIPGNDKITFDAFWKAKNLAMFVNVNRLSQMKDGEKEGLRWDMAQFPSYSKNPNKSVAVDQHILFPTAASPNQDMAMKVIQTIVSEEVQKISAAKTGRLSALKNPEVLKNLGKEMDFLKDKNVDAIFKSKPVSLGFVHKEDSKLSGIMTKNYTEMLAKDTDVNTVLRNTEEEMNKLLDSLMN